jgi:uroporphyrinogen-III synthase
VIYLLSPTEHEGVENLSMIEFETTTTKIDFCNIDLLLFTSKQAVITTDLIDKSWHNISSIAIGEGTKTTILELGGKVEFVASKSYGNELAHEIIKRFKNLKILYLRPEIVSSNITKILLDANININEQVVYKTNCKQYNKSQKPPPNSIIIATSPSVLNCFLKNFGWCESYIGVAIGKTTAMAFGSNMDFVISDMPTISSCIIKANEIQKISKINHH